MLLHAILLPYFQADVHTANQLPSEYVLCIYSHLQYTVQYVSLSKRKDPFVDTSPTHALCPAFSKMYKVLPIHIHNSLFAQLHPSLLPRFSFHWVPFSSGPFPSWFPSSLVPFLLFPSSLVPWFPSSLALLTVPFFCRSLIS